MTAAGLHPLPEPLPARVTRLAAECDFDRFDVEIVAGDDAHGVWFEVQSVRPDAITGETGRGYGGRRYVDPLRSDSDVVRGIFGAVLAYLEHETRESFLWRGKAIFGPHVSIEALYSVADDTDYRIRPRGAQL